MSEVYTSIAGDTFEIISRRRYGVASLSGRISEANPGVLEPIPAGTVLTIPDPVDLPTLFINIGDANTLDECALLIDQTRFRFWESIRVVQTIDGPSAIEFEAPFEPTNESHRNLFKPFSYKDAEFTVGGVPFFKGTLVGVKPSQTSDARSVVISGYGKPGVLYDCVAPPDINFEFRDLTVAEIATQLSAPFGIRTVLASSDGVAFPKTAIRPDQKMANFLIDLCKQRTLLMRDNAAGELVIGAPDTTSPPVAALEEGQSPLEEIEALFDPRNYFSSVTGFEPTVVKGAAGSRYTVENARLTGVVRPISFKVQDVRGGDVRGAVESKAARMFASAVSYSATVLSWRKKNGTLWAPGDIVTLLAPGAMVYSRYTLIVRSVIFERTQDSATATLDLTMPGAFTGNIPEVLPWDT